MHFLKPPLLNLHCGCFGTGKLDSTGECSTLTIEHLPKVEALNTLIYKVRLLVHFDNSVSIALCIYY